MPTHQIFEINTCWVGVKNVASPEGGITEEGSYRFKQNTKFQLEGGYSVRTSFGTYYMNKLLHKSSWQKKEN
jgi:hypothetical protein